MSTATVTNHQPTRERVLARLWQIADLSPEATRNNINGQLKALTMIVAIEGLIPNKFNTQQKPAAVPAPAERPRVSTEAPIHLDVPKSTLLDLATSAISKVPTKAGKPWDPSASLADNLAGLAGRR